MSDDQLYQQYLKETGQAKSNDPLYEQYLKETGQAGIAQAQPEIEDDIHPEMSGLEGLKLRTVYKAFSSDPEAGLRYLQKNKPNLKFTRDKSGEVLVSDDWSGGKAYRLDPTGLDIRDASDLVFDIPAGIAQGVATTAGGVAGLASPVPGGALIGGAAASGASGAGLEYVRQIMGKAAGIDQDINNEDVLMSGAIGAASVPLFGTGAALKNVVGSKAVSSGKNTLEQALSAQSGVIGRTLSKVSPRLASLAGGYDPEVIKSASKNLEFIKNSKKNPESAVALIEAKKETFTGALNQARSQVGQKYADVGAQIDAQVGQGIETAKLLEGLNKLKTRLSTTGLQNEPRKDSIKEVDDIVTKYFFVDDTSLPPLPDGTMPKIIKDKISFAEAQQLQSNLRDYATENGLSFKNIGTTKSVNQAKGDKTVLNSLSETQKIIKGEMDDVARKAAPELKDQYNELGSQYRMFKDLEDDFYNASKSGESFTRFLKKKDINSDAAKKTIKNISGEDMNQLAADITAIEMFRNPQWTIPAMGNSNTARTLGLAGAGAFIGSQYGNQSGGGTYLPTMIGAGLGSVAGSPAAFRMLMTANKGIRKDIPNKVPPYLSRYQLLNAYKNEEK